MSWSVNLIGKPSNVLTALDKESERPTAISTLEYLGIVSWSVNLIGKPSNVLTALDKESERMAGNSKKEFDACLSNLKGLVQANYSKEDTTVLQLVANGHEYHTEDGERTYATCQVNLSLLPGVLV